MRYRYRQSVLFKYMPQGAHILNPDATRYRRSAIGTAIMMSVFSFKRSRCDEKSLSAIGEFVRILSSFIRCDENRYRKLANHSICIPFVLLLANPTRYRVSAFTMICFKKGNNIPFPRAMRYHLNNHNL